MNGVKIAMMKIFGKYCLLNNEVLKKMLHFSTF